MNHARWIAAVLLLTPALLFAQAQGRVKGTVKDSQGKPIPDAKVTITCPEVTTYHKEAITDKKGTFTTLIVDATKNYLFHVDAANYQSVEQLNKPLIGGQTLNLEFVLLSMDEARQQAQDEAFEQPGLKQVREGKALLDAGDKAAAKAKFAEAVQLKPDLHLAWFELAVLAAEEGKHQEALDNAKKCVALQANFGPCLSVAANAAKELGDTEAYNRYLSSYKLANPTDPAIMFNDAVELLNKGDDAGAKPLLEQALEIDPKFPDALFQLGMVNLRGGDNAKAKELLQQFLEVAPTHKDAPVAKEMLQYL